MYDLIYYPQKLSFFGSSSLFICVKCYATGRERHYSMQSHNIDQNTTFTHMTQE